MTPEERAAHEREVDALSAEARRIINRHLAWHLRLGRLHVSTPVPSQALFWVFVVFHAVSGTTGGVLILQGGRASDLGIAMLVGALFALGAFTSQVWAFTVERERDVLGVLLEDERQQLRGLVDRLTDLEARLTVESGVA